MIFRHIFKNRAASPPQKPGKNLLCEILLFLLVFAVSSLGNLLIMIPLCEYFLLSSLGDFTYFAVSGDPLKIMEEILSSPSFFIMMLLSTAATIAVVILFCRIFQKRSWSSMGLSVPHAFPHYIRGILFGTLSICLLAGICIITGAGYLGNGSEYSTSNMFLFLLAYLIQGASEELLCRGYFMNSIARRHPMWLAVVTNAVFFALLHIPNSGVSAVAFLNLFLFGVLAALVTIQTGSIWYACGFHSAWNFVQGNVFGIKVSGMDMNCSLFRFVSTPSKAYLNGGDFGLEGGLLCTILFAATILFFLYQMGRNTPTS